MPQRKPVIKRASRRVQAAAAPRPSGASDYEDFVIHARRGDTRAIALRVYASPAGAMPAPVSVAFPASEAQRLHASFYSDPTTTGQAGRALITQDEATELGKRLSAVLLPPPVFRLLAESLARVVRTPGRGLRIRLSLDESLMDLPWEYVYRPDHLESSGVSGFLLLEPKISMVREAANPRIALEPITGRQRLSFVGTLWEGKVDGWQVGTEFELLRSALKPVSGYISAGFALAGDPDAFGRGLGRNSAIFHYAGHCDFERNGRPYLVREMPTTGDLAGARKVHLDELAPALGQSGVRLAVLSACNSGFWPVVKPLLAAELPAVVGVNGAVASQSTIEFCARLYESLAVGLTLDEAVGHARLHVLNWGHHHQLFDWGLYMVYMPSPQAALFPRTSTRTIAARQAGVRREHGAVAESTLQLARELDGLNFGEIMSELTERRVLILGRFTDTRLEILEGIKAHLARHPNRYIPELFTFKKPKSRDLTEAVTGFAALSRFIIADLSEPRRVQTELEAIVSRFLSVPVVPLISQYGKGDRVFEDILRRQNVVKPPIRYRDFDDLKPKLDAEVVPKAEAKLLEVRPQG
jgi:hypothetical protein